jgi:SpoVK/Ycf46/Vps4 family AAA+-type ATPase
MHSPFARNDQATSRPLPPTNLQMIGEVPGLSEIDQTMLRVRLLEVATQVVREKRPGPFRLSVIHGESSSTATPPPADRAQAPSSPRSADDEGGDDFTAMDPMWHFDQLVLPAAVNDMLLDCVSYAELAPKVFDTWNLRSIEPHPSVAMNFRGPPGTGKTMAAHALASRMNRKILLSRLSDLESKYHGDGPKNVVKLFESAARQNAVLFIDEAESMLSRRFAQPDQAAESAINSMRTELLMALDAFEGLVIFASNLHDSYDAAISARLTHIDFLPPDEEARRGLWRSHLPAELPLAADVDIEILASIDGVTGRDIKRAVVAAAVAAARRTLPAVSMELLDQHIRRQIADPPQAPSAPPSTIAIGPLEAEIKARLNEAPTAA